MKLILLTVDTDNYFDNTLKVWFDVFDWSNDGPILAGLWTHWCSWLMSDSLTYDPPQHFLSLTFKATTSAMLPLRQCNASVPILGPTCTAGAGVHIKQLLSCGEWNTHTYICNTHAHKHRHIYAHSEKHLYKHIDTQKYSCISTNNYAL